jgi:mRNA-degrading endonuclease HigB of HigAB toxin-antitoxin module
MSLIILKSVEISYCNQEVALKTLYRAQSRQTIVLTLKNNICEKSYFKADSAADKYFPQNIIKAANRHFVFAQLCQIRPIIWEVGNIDTKKLSSSIHLRIA